MKATSDQTELLLSELERRARVLQDCSEKLETQLKVMLVQQSQAHFPDELVARIANALAVCLSSRGDWEQAGQYARMAANLERRHEGVRQQAGRSTVRPPVVQPEAVAPMRPEEADRVSPDRNSFGQSLRFLLKAFRRSA